MNRSAHQRGITLLEIMIALGLGAFMLVGIITLMASVSATRTELTRSSEQLENGRYAVQILSDDAALGGYYGPYYNGGPVLSNPSPCATDATLSDLGIAYGATPTLPTAVSGIAAGGTLPACVTNAIANAQVLVIRHVNPVPVAATAAVNGDPYMQVSFCDSENEFVFSNAKANFTLTGKDCTTVQPVWSYESRAYYVASCDDCGDGDGDGGDAIPTLKVAEYSSGSLQVYSLVEGVEDMNVRYGMDLNRDGSPDCYISDPAVDALPAGCADPFSQWDSDDAQNWGNVVALDIHVLIRSLDEYSDWEDTRTYDLGRNVRSGPFKDGFKRKVLKASAMLPNVAGARE